MLDMTKRKVITTDLETFEAEHRLVLDLLTQKRAFDRLLLLLKPIGEELKGAQARNSTAARYIASCVWLWDHLSMPPIHDESEVMLLLESWK